MSANCETMIIVHGDDRAAMTAEDGGWMIALVNSEGDRLYHTVKGRSITAEKISMGAEESATVVVDVMVDAELACAVYFLDDDEAANAFVDNVRAMGDKAGAESGSAPEA